MNGKSSNEWIGPCLKETNYMHLEENASERRQSVQEMKVGQTGLGNLRNVAENITSRNASLSLFFFLFC